MSLIGEAAVKIPVTTPNPGPHKVVVRVSSLAPATLNHADRCDRCGARAYVAAMIAAGRAGMVALLFCAHHFRRWEDGIRDAAVQIIDERYQLDEGVAAQKRAQYPNGN